MGITLTYKPSPEPSREVLKAMVDEAVAIKPLQEWWCEPLGFLEVPSRGVLGMTKVSFPGYSGKDGSYIEVDQGEDFLMMWSDISHILGVLSGWSKKFGFRWDVQLEGGPFGSVDSSGLESADIKENLAQLLQLSGAPEDPRARQGLIEAISAKYKSRWE